MKDNLIGAVRRDELRHLEQFAIQLERGAAANLYTRPAHEASPTNLQPISAMTVWSAVLRVIVFLQRSSEHGLRIQDIG